MDIEFFALPQDSIYRLYDDYEIIDLSFVEMRIQIYQLESNPEDLELFRYDNMLLLLLIQGYKLYFVNHTLYANDKPYLSSSGELYKAIDQSKVRTIVEYNNQPNNNNVVYLRETFIVA